MKSSAVETADVSSQEYGQDAPSPRQIEISVFGKGYGEAIAIHVGDGRWLAIDSVGFGKSSVTRAYLEALQVDLSTNVDLIVATHWHDDHVRGISDLFSVCGSSEIVVPQAMLDEEFIKFAASFQDQSSRRFSAGIEEFGRILEIAKDRHVPGSRWPLRLSAGGYVGYRKAPGTLSHGQLVTLEALSPSHHDLASFLARISGIKPDPSVLQRAPNPRPNEVSCALWLQVGNDAVLLAADLENTAGADSGWNAVLNSSILPTQKAALVKIPHHGGLSGHHEGMWNSMLTDQPLGVLTPWTRGGRRLPVEADVKRICGLTANAFSTGPSVLGKELNEPTAVVKILRKDNVRVNSLINKLGHVRHRALVDGSALEWQTDLFGRACALSAMAA